MDGKSGKGVRITTFTNRFPRDRAVIHMIRVTHMIESRSRLLDMGRLFMTESPRMQ